DLLADRHETPGDSGLVAGRRRRRRRSPRLGLRPAARLRASVQRLPDSADQTAVLVAALIHSGGGGIWAFGSGPGSGRPLPVRQEIARTVMSWSHTIWHESRTPVAPFAARTCCSATVIRAGSPSMNCTRQVVHRALPPHACSTSTPAFCS